MSAEWTNAESKLLEKFREMAEKRSFRDGETIGRSFTIPNPLDSDEMINISLTLNCKSADMRLGSEVLSEAVEKIIKS